jgi:protein-S-isoprenylcysteine O-methyltransferase Ste14
LFSQAEKLIKEARGILLINFLLGISLGYFFNTKNTFDFDYGSLEYIIFCIYLPFMVVTLIYTALVCMTYLIDNSLYDIAEYGKNKKIDTHFWLAKKIRHPKHYGLLLGQFIIFTLTLNIITIILFIVIVLNTIKLCRIDDQLLEIKYPDQFPEWKSRTKLLIPYFY